MTRGRRFLLIGLGLVLSAGCGDNLKPGGTQGVAPPLAQADGGPPGAAWVRFAPDLATAERRSFRRWFPLYGTRDILAVIAAPDVSGTRVMRLEIIGPEGTAYQTIWRAFTTDSSTGGTTAHPVTGAPVPVQPATVVAGQARVIVPIAVAGTHITRYGLRGVYTAQVFLEGADPVCESTFEIRGRQ